MTVKRTKARSKDAVVQPTLRIREWLRRELSKSADANHRDLNSEMNYRLEQSVRAEQRQQLEAAE